MQEAAAKHWAANKNTALKDDISWVVKRHEIDYHFPAFLNDKLLMRTWTGAFSAVTWDRHYEIIRPVDQKKIITAKSVWVLLNKISGRPRRIDESIIRIFENQ
jgi:acyl-CoA thioester hydrolase